MDGREAVDDGALRCQLLCAGIALFDVFGEGALVGNAERQGGQLFRSGAGHVSS
jgi:hypothetical protein